MAIELTFSSVLEAPPDVVWERAGRVSGINDELWPLARMTCPAHLGRIAAPPHESRHQRRTVELRRLAR